jgi:hypothetical protein
LVHGTAGPGTSMHALAEALRAAGVTAYVLDIRGHGGSGRRGDIDYIGQLVADQYAPLLQRLGVNIPVTMVSNMKHTDMIATPAALQAVVRVVGQGAVHSTGRTGRNNLYRHRKDAERDRMFLVRSMTFTDQLRS